MDKNNYNRTKEYENEIVPLLRDIMVKCSYYSIPMFATFAVANTPEETTYRSSVIHAMLNKDLAEDEISTLLLSLNGFSDDYPDSVKEHIRGLTQYLEQMSTNIEENVLERPVVLAEDKIETLHNVVRGKRKVKVDTKKNAAENTETEEK